MAVIGEFTVYLRDDDGTVHTFLPGESVPAWAAKQMGDHCFADASDTGVEADGSDGPPPQSGRGSGREKWAAYAEANGVDTDGLDRDEIIAACQEAEVPVE